MFGLGKVDKEDLLMQLQCVGADIANNSTDSNDEWNQLHALQMVLHKFNECHSLPKNNDTLTYMARVRNAKEQAHIKRMYKK